MKKNICYWRASGLDIDYGNAWDHLGSIHHNFSSGIMTRREFLEALKIPIQTYEEYMKEQNPWRFEEAMQHAKPEALEKLNQIVAEYNSLCLLAKRHETTSTEYDKRMREIIEGECQSQVHARSHIKVNM